MRLTQVKRERGSRPSRVSLEVDAHHDAAGGRVTDLGEPGGSEDAAAAHMELVPGNLLPRSLAALPTAVSRVAIADSSHQLTSVHRRQVYAQRIRFPRH